MVMADGSKAAASWLDEKHRIWGGGRIAGAAFVPDPSPLLSSSRDRRGSLQQQETGLQVRSSQGRTAEAKIFQKMCVLTGVTNPRWLEQAIGSEDYRRPALCTVTVPNSRVGAARWQWHSYT
jgi:hypothetical protein